MPPKRPVAVVVIAVLQVVFGVAGLCGSASQLPGLDEQFAAAGQADVPGQKLSPLDVFKYWREHVPGERAVEHVAAALSVVLSLMMIASAVGLLRLRPWGWYLALAYAVLSILGTAADTAYNFGALAPALAEFTRGIAATGGADAQQAAQALQIAFLALFALSAFTAVYPVVVLLVLCRRPVRAAFGGEPLPAEAEDYRDAAPPGDRPQAGAP